MNDYYVYEIAKQRIDARIAERRSAQLAARLRAARSGSPRPVRRNIPHLLTDWPTSSTPGPPSQRGTTRPMSVADR